MSTFWSNFINDIHLKEITAIIVLLFGLGITLAGFIVAPTGIVDSSVMWIAGQCFIYVGSIFGISTHYQSKQIELENKLMRRIERKNNEEEDDADQ